MKLSTVCWNSFAVFLIEINCKNVWDILNDFLRAMIPWSALEAKIQAGICRPRCFLDSLPWSFQICTPTNFPPEWCCCWWWRSTTSVPLPPSTSSASASSYFCSLPAALFGVQTLGRLAKLGGVVQYPQSNLCNAFWKVQSESLWKIFSNSFDQRKIYCSWGLITEA